MKKDFENIPPGGFPPDRRYDKIRQAVRYTDRRMKNDTE